MYQSGTKDYNRHVLLYRNMLSVGESLVKPPQNKENMMKVH